MVTGSARRAPVHPLAWFGIVTAVLAGLLGLYGAMYAEKHVAGSPLREARGDAKVAPLPGSWVERQIAAGETKAFGTSFDEKVRKATSESKIANYTLQTFAFVVPFFLGIGAGLIGAEAMRAVQRAGGRYVGNTLAVFSMLIGGLASVTGACMMLALYVWPHLPSPYTT